ncbi:MAG: hypothetical protein QF819_02230 [Gemmatimonadota bacterium]|nr:hypothetical protein [Gemmatimonadota bacterium]MDP7031325.1 hypothetical protein [Gemmatimonadota bacterium]
MRMRFDETTTLPWIFALLLVAAIVTYAVSNLDAVSNPLIEIARGMRS